MLLAAISALIERLKTVFSQELLLTHEREIARTRASVESARWEAAWQIGRGRSLDDMVAFALGEE